MYEVVGRCPVCGNDIVNYVKSYGCKNWKNGCQVTIWKDLYDKQISIEEVQRLLEGEVIGAYEFSTKNGGTFRAKLRLLDNGEIKFIYEPELSEEDE